MEVLTFYVFCATAMMFSTLALALAFISLAKVVGMEKSTHQVQYVPMETPNMGGPTLDEGIGMTPQNATEMMNKMYPSFNED